MCENISNSDSYEDLFDFTLYINDLLSLNKYKINFILRNSIFYYFLLPDIFQSLYILIYENGIIKGENKYYHIIKKKI